MKIKVHMICIIEDRQFREIQPLPTEKYIKGTVLEGSDRLITFQHYRAANERAIYRLGFALTELDSGQSPENYTVSIVANDSETRLAYDFKSKFFYDNSGSPIGISSVGICYALAKDWRGAVVAETPPIIVKPSSMDEVNYYKMLDDLAQIHRGLVTGKSGLSNISKREYTLKAISDCIEVIKGPLENINQRPAIALKTKFVKRPASQDKNLYGRAILEKQLFPGRKKYTMRECYEDTDIYENRAIKNALIMLKKFIARSIDEGDRSLEQFDAEIKITENIINQIKSGSVSREDIGEIDASFYKKISQDIEEKNSKNCYDKKAEQLIKEIDSLLDLDFFIGVKSEHTILKPSQVFTHDPFYCQVWSALKALDQSICYTAEFDILNFEEIKEKEKADVTWQLYEHWCYFKMIALLQERLKWELENGNELAEKLEQYLRAGKNTDGIDMRAVLKHDYGNNESIILTLCYNRNIYNGIKKVTPDYTFKFKKGNNQIVVFADAKYRNYCEQGKFMFLGDIKGVAVDKYLNPMLNLGLPVKASFIFHPDPSNSYTNFGGGDNICGFSKSKLGVDDIGNCLNHRVGAIAFLPDKESNFLLFMKMVLEYHLGLTSVCWNCGETEKITSVKKCTRKGYTKYHYKCHNCGEFWVKTHCFDKECGNDILIKHIINYHVPFEYNYWNVKCPVCGSHLQENHNEDGNGLTVFELISFSESDPDSNGNLPF